MRVQIHTDTDMFKHMRVQLHTDISKHIHVHEHSQTHLNTHRHRDTHIHAYTLAFITLSQKSEFPDFCRYPEAQNVWCAFGKDRSAPDPFKGSSSLLHTF